MILCGKKMIRPSTLTHLIRRSSNEPPHLLHQLEAYIEIENPQDDEKRRRHRSANDTPNLTKRPKSVADGRGSRGDHDRSYNHNSTADGSESEDNGSGAEKVYEQRSKLPYVE